MFLLIEYVLIEGNDCGSHYNVTMGKENGKKASSCLLFFPVSLLDGFKMIIINSSVDALGILILKIREKTFLKQVLYFSSCSWRQLPKRN